MMNQKLHAGLKQRVDGSSSGSAQLHPARFWCRRTTTLQLGSPSTACMADQGRSTMTSKQALEGDQWVGHEEVIRMLASHMSLECDFDPEDVWPWLKPHALVPLKGDGEPVAQKPAVPRVPSPARAGSPLRELLPQPAKHTPPPSQKHSEHQLHLHSYGGHHHHKVQHQQAPTEPQLSCIVEMEHMEKLVSQMQAITDVADKVALLEKQERVQVYLNDVRHNAVCREIRQLSREQQYLLLCLPAMGQDHVLTLPNNDTGGDAMQVRIALTKLASTLQCVEQFYDSIGGVLGYQHRSLGLIVEGTPELRQAKREAQNTSEINPGNVNSVEVETKIGYHVPRALDLAGEGGREVGNRTAAAGLMALPHMAEIYPVGGAGDRLGLKCDITGECLPAAMLPYCGRTMMEGLLRDLQAREYLYFKLTGKQMTTPVAIMSSEAKGNHQLMTQLMENLKWFGRGKAAFRIFKQPLVPVINTTDGKWLLNGIMDPMSKPGGHGVIWKLMWDQGVFSWLNSMNRKSALVRQISNPMAGMDTTLLALAGCGWSRKKSAFGFMSCDRTIGASEGCNVLQERYVRRGDKIHYEYGYTNIEYTEFERLGISDQPVDGTSRRSVFPANTNVLYVGLKEAQKVVHQAITSSNPEQLMPGLIFNLKKKVSYSDPLTGKQEKLHAGRMECTMQNIADYMTDKLDTALLPSEAAERELSTFLVYNMRRKVTSSAKKRREAGSTRISQTPDGSFYDLQRNAWHLLQQCAVKQVPELGSVEQYLEDGPGFIFLFNPALGPLWDVISQKLVGGSLQHGSEMVLEVAEARIQDVHVEGSLLVYADNVVGHWEPVPEADHASGAPTIAQLNDTDTNKSQEMRLHYSSACGRIYMTDVHVKNAGVDWSAPSNIYWKHQVARREAVRVLLRGQSEFEAHSVTLTGDLTFEVPDGYRMMVSQDTTGALDVTLTPLTWGMPTWQWAYTMSEAGQVHLQFTTGAGIALPAAPQTPPALVPPRIITPPAPSPPARPTPTPRVRLGRGVPSKNGTPASDSALPGVTVPQPAQTTNGVPAPVVVSPRTSMQQLAEADPEVDFTI